MNKKIIAIASFALALSFILVAASYAADDETTGTKAKKAVQAVVTYPGNVVKESVNVVAETGKRGSVVVAKTGKRVGQVVTGDVGKTKELVTEPITGTAETAYKAVEGTAKVPVAAAKQDTEEAKK